MKADLEASCNDSGREKLALSSSFGRFQAGRSRVQVGAYPSYISSHSLVASGVSLPELSLSVWSHQVVSQSQSGLSQSLQIQIQSSHPTPRINLPLHLPMPFHRFPKPQTVITSRLATPPPHRLIRKHARHDRHNDIQRGTNIDRHRSSRVRSGGDSSAHDAHDSVQADGDAVAGAAVRGGQDFGRVGVEGAVVDVLREKLEGLGLGDF